MKELGKRLIGTGTKGLEFKEGARRRLSSNSVGTCAPSLKFNPNNEPVSTDAEIDYLAQILVEIYLESEHVDKT